MSGFVFKKRRYLFLTGLLSLLLIEGLLFYVFDEYLKETTTEFVTSWYKTEEIEIKSGNILPAIAKNQRMLFSSSFVRGVFIVEKNVIEQFATGSQGSMPFLANFGTMPLVDLKVAYANADNDGVSDIGLFSKLAFLALPGTPAMLVCFWVAPQFLKFLFALASLFILGSVGLTLYLFMALQKKEHQALMAQKEVAMAYNQKIADISRQVSHDIRSPLAALEMALKNTEIISTEGKELIDGAAKRIRCIADDLLDNKSARVQCVYLSPLVSELVKEKMVEFSACAVMPKLNLEIRANATDVQANIDELALKRALSNLINNASEALGGNGEIQITLALEDNESRKIRLTVADNGPGIAGEILAKLQAGPYSHGKLGGQGLGLKQAKEMCANAFGHLEIKSALGKGTEVSLILPIAAYKSPSMSVLIDNDEIVRMVWNLSAKKHGKNLKCCKSFEEFMAIPMDSLTEKENIVVYLDSDLDDGVKGQDLISKFQAMGFSSIKMVTGYDAKDLGLGEGIEVLGKSPPWEHDR